MFVAFGKGQKVLVASGWSNYNYAKTTEVIDLANAANTCKNLPKLANLRMGAAGGLIEQKWPLICGGYPYDKNCEVIGGMDQGTIPELLAPRRWPGSVVLMDKNLWITGGPDNGELGSSDTSEVVNIVDGTIATSTPLPLNIWNHCLVRFNEDLVLLIGGSKDMNTESAETWWFNIRRDQWSRGPTLNQARRNHSCAVFKDLTTNNTIVAVAGGSNNNTLLDSVEVFDGGESWGPGPKLAKPIESAQMVAKEFSAVLLGGYDGAYSLFSLYELTCEFGTCFWRGRPQRLEERRQDFVAMIVPDELVDCNN